MVTAVTRMFAVLVSALAILGLFTNGHLFDLMNVDTLLDWARVGLAALLIYAGFFTRSIETRSRTLLFVGVVYIGLALAGLINSTLGGALPSGLTGFDIAFHLATGLLAVLLGSRSVSDRPLTHST